VRGSKPTRGFGLLEGLLASRRSKMANRLVPPRHRADRVLDIGCGSFPVFLLSTCFAERFGLDKVVNDSMRAAYNERGIVLINFEIESEGLMPFDQGLFSVVTMLAVVEHIEPQRLVQLFHEVHRILKLGGVLIITTPAAWTDPLLRLMARVRLVSPVEIEEHKAPYAPSLIQSLLEQAGFASTRMRHGYFELFANMWFVAEK
jgi:SAM-dependent methyltransferase